MTPGATSTANNEFGAYLRASRQERSIHLTEVARQTRIPVRSLEHLEAGNFDKLPADIFVRGFIRSYADCVGLEPVEALDRYRDLGRKPPSLSAVRARVAEQSSTEIEASNSVALAGDSRSSTVDQKRRRTMFPELSDSEREGRRGPVTVAVIILVIVATLAMSYLLRRPSADSDGFTALPSESGERLG